MLKDFGRRDLLLLLYEKKKPLKQHYYEQETAEKNYERIDLIKDTVMNEFSFGSVIFLSVISSVREFGGLL